MSWIEKLCEVYDSAVERAAEPPLLPVGFVMKQIRFNVTLSADGRFARPRNWTRNVRIAWFPARRKRKDARERRARPFRWRIA